MTAARFPSAKTETNIIPKVVRLPRLLAGMAPTMERQHPLRAVWDDRLTVSANGEGE
jgi:hypothetical protein